MQKKLFPKNKTLSPKNTHTLSGILQKSMLPHKCHNPLDVRQNKIEVLHSHSHNKCMRDFHLKLQALVLGMD
jgi:hypothetical protein